MAEFSTELMPIDQIAARIAAAHGRLLRAIAPLSDAQMQAPVLGEHGWSVKDVLAHLAFWDRRLLYAVDPQEWPEDGPTSAAQRSRRFPPPIADIPYPDGWLEAVNTRIYTRNKDRDLDDVRAAFDRTRARLPAVTSALSAQAVSDLDSLTAPLGEPFSAMLVGAYEHYDEHAEELEAHTFA